MVSSVAMCAAMASGGCGRAGEGEGTRRQARDGVDVGGRRRSDLRHGTRVLTAETDRRYLVGQSSRSARSTGSPAARTPRGVQRAGTVSVWSPWNVSPVSATHPRPRRKDTSTDVATFGQHRRHQQVLAEEELRSASVRAGIDHPGRAHSRGHQWPPPRRSPSWYGYNAA